MLSFVEFTYNRRVHSTTKHSPSIAVYMLNPITHLDLALVPISERTCPDGKKKVEVIKVLH